MYRTVLSVLLISSASAKVEYCSAATQECESLKLPVDFGADVFLGEADDRPPDLMELMQTANLTRYRYMGSKPRPRKSAGASIGAKFRNFRRSRLDMRWDDGSREGVYSGEIAGLGRTSTLSYIGHTFFFLDPQTKNEVARFTMEAGVNLYIIPPTPEDEETRISPAYQETLAEHAFMADYEARTGTPWLSHFGRDPPILNMWPAESIGQTHVVASTYSHFVDDETQLAGDLAMTLRVVSHAPAGPRVFLIKDLLSDFECDHIINLGQNVIRQSMVGQNGGFKSKTRTSANGWLHRRASPVLEIVYKRFGDVLGIDDELLVPQKNAEELQVVRYDKTQEYAPHHDFGDDGTPEQRFLTLLLYIQLPEDGGATSFPKAFDGRGVEIVPNRGDAILFYNMLPDGNADDLALHAGMPVKAGQKWVCNLWIWDPHR